MDLLASTCTRGGGVCGGRRAGVEETEERALDSADSTNGTSPPNGAILDD